MARAPRRTVGRLPGGLGAVLLGVISRFTIGSRPGIAPTRGMDSLVGM
jgi:hypothetical protein